MVQRMDIRPHLLRLSLNISLRGVGLGRLWGRMSLRLEASVEGQREFSSRVWRDARPILGLQVG